MKKLLVVLIVLVVVLGAIGYVTPKDYQVAKSITIDAPPAAVHAYVGDLQRWPEWTPWAEHDASLETTYGAKTTGVGAHQSWTSEGGDGELTLTMSDPAKGIAYDMAFIDEEARIPATSAMTYEPAADGGTVVTWTMQGTWDGAVPPVMDGWMKILSPMMIGGMFDEGLANLKSRVESSSS